MIAGLGCKSLGPVMIAQGLMMMSPEENRSNALPFLAQITGSVFLATSLLVILDWRAGSILLRDEWPLLVVIELLSGSLFLAFMAALMNAVYRARETPR